MCDPRVVPKRALFPDGKLLLSDSCRVVANSDHFHCPSQCSACQGSQQSGPRVYRCRNHCNDCSALKAMLAVDRKVTDAGLDAVTHNLHATKKAHAAVAQKGLVYQTWRCLTLASTQKSMSDFLSSQVDLPPFPRHDQGTDLHITFSAESILDVGHS